MEDQKKEVDAIVASSEAPTFQNTTEALARTGALLDKVNAVFSALRSANTTDDLQKIANEVTPLLSKHRDDINLNEKLFRRVKAVYEQRKKLKLDGEQAKLLEETYKDFIRGGATASSLSSTTEMISPDLPRRSSMERRKRQRRQNLKASGCSRSRNPV
jgi:peptidyl-dipeptidase Dcp